MNPVLGKDGVWRQDYGVIDMEPDYAFEDFFEALDGADLGDNFDDDNGEDF